MQTKIGKTTLRLVTGDIADQDTDAVVTAAHWRLNKGNGTDGTIHTKGGPKVYEECRRIGGLRRGTLFTLLARSGEVEMRKSRSCWRVPIVGVCRSRHSMDCA